MTITCSHVFLPIGRRCRRTAVRLVELQLAKMEVENGQLVSRSVSARFARGRVRERERERELNIPTVPTTSFTL